MQSINRFLYGPTPEEKVRAWQAKLRAEQRQLDREMRQLDQATSKARQNVKSLATKGDVKNARILAREVVRSNKQKDRLSVSKARLGSINNQLQQQLGAGIMEEMMEDVLDMDEDEELEEEADAEVDKVLFDLTDGKLGQVAPIENDLPTLEDEALREETERTMEKYRQQLNGILS
ncbi:hypothetical protein NMY22_g9382 [Coprinellus aureogranulatus]|nr:hypothetical protein NMY22_g9382 [Coprinellus aureogranulatus]